MFITLILVFGTASACHFHNSCDSVEGEKIWNWKKVEGNLESEQLLICQDYGSEIRWNSVLSFSVKADLYVSQSKNITVGFKGWRRGAGEWVSSTAEVRNMSHEVDLRQNRVKSEEFTLDKITSDLPKATTCNL